MSIFDELSEIDKKGAEKISNSRQEEERSRRKKENEENEETKKREVEEFTRDIQVILNSDQKGIDEPELYEYSILVATNPFIPKVERQDTKRAISIRQLRMIKKLSEIGIGILSGKDRKPLLKKDTVRSKEDEIFIDTEKRKAEAIISSEDSELDKKGIMQLKIPIKLKRDGSYYIEWVGVEIETTLRQVLLCAPNFDLEEINFKTYEQIEKEKQGREEKEKTRESEQSSKKGTKITLDSIRRGILRCFKGER